VLRYARGRGLLADGGRVLVGVSGGPDSSALLLVLASLRRRLGIEVRAAYFDHRLRGPRASALERRVVEELASRVSAPLVAGSDDVRRHAREGRVSIEEAARELRYRFLAEGALEGGCGAVAVGHTVDDQVETVLLHLLRGSGLKGLGGMPPRSPWPLPVPQGGPILVRPLLEISRAEAERYCREAGVRVVRDPSNRSKAFKRNRVRGELLPLLRSYNPRIDQALLRLADAARGDVEFIEGAARDVIGDAAVMESNEVRIDQRRVRGLPRSLRFHVMRLAAQQLLGDARDLGQRHLDALVAVLERPVGSRLDLLRGLHVEVGYEEISLSLGARRATPRPLPDGEVRLWVPGRTVVGGWTFEVEVVGPGEVPTGDALEALVDADAVGCELWVRGRRRGDRFRPLGMAGEKKLQDFLVDERVSRAERDALPLVCGPPGILWVVGRRIAEWAKVGPGTARVLRLRARPG
jgi:tRNA(Ile)-lysidine synthase